MVRQDCYDYYNEDMDERHTSKEAKSGEAVTPRKSSHVKERSETPIENTDTYEFDSDKIYTKCMINF